MLTQYQIINLEPGSEEWLAFRKTKITATDASVIMKANPWKTSLQLYQEKISEENKTFTNERMKRGTDLEPLARELFNLRTGFKMEPVVLVKDWVMASLDGFDSVSGNILEVKCPGEKDHAIAVSGKVPGHYYPQLQHQMYVADADKAYYFSFDGIDGVIVEVMRDAAYIDKMMEEEAKFFECLQNKTAPECAEYNERSDEAWKRLAVQWKSVTQCIRDLEKEEEDIRKELIGLSGEQNSKGAGVSLCRFERKGNIDYTKIDELKNIDLETYRKPTTISWRINILDVKSA